jgi:hypothetical protein
LNKDLEKLVFKCDTADDYIKTLENLQKDTKYKLGYEKNIKDTIKKYIKD